MNLKQSEVRTQIVIELYVDEYLLTGIRTERT